MRLVSYNILHGGEGRADPLAEVLEAQRADIVCLQEACHDEVLDRIANRLNMDVVQARAGKTACAILSRWPIIESINHGAIVPGLGKSLLETMIQDPQGKEWIVFTLHLHAHAREADEQHREQDLKKLVAVTARHRESRAAHILAGDFNASSPIQKIDPARCKPATREEWDANGGGIPRRVITRVLEMEYVDSLHAARGDYATSSGTFTTQFPEQRVDYIFTHGIEPRRIKHAWIEQDRLAKYASDHFPIGVEISD